MSITRATGVPCGLTRKHWGFRRHSRPPSEAGAADLLATSNTCRRAANPRAARLHVLVLDLCDLTHGTDRTHRCRELPQMICV
jgi:hypothetical protein